MKNACSCFENLWLKAASKSINLTKSSTKIKKKSNEWYDDELYVKRSFNSKASLVFKQPFNASLRNLYFKHYREYRKLLKFQRKNYYLSIYLYLMLLSRSFTDHHLRCGGWLNFEFSKRGKHLGLAIKTIYKLVQEAKQRHAKTHTSEP